MPKPHLLSVDESIAYGAKLSGVNLVYHYETPQTSAVGKAMKNLNIPVSKRDSASGAINAAIGSAIGGKRAFVLSSLLNFDEMAAVSYRRLPIVFSTGSLGDCGIIHIADSGSLVFMPESNQELVDTVVQACKVSEDPSVLLPSFVGTDMAHCSELVQLPDEKFTTRYVSKFSSPYNLGQKLIYLDAPVPNSRFVMQRQKAMKNALALIEKTSAQWSKKFNRALPLIETYKLDDAECALVMAGFHSTTAKEAINRMRNDGKKVGMLRLRVLRPLPTDVIRNALNGAKTCVFDQAVSIGTSGVLHKELRPYIGKSVNFISIGKYPGEKDFMQMLDHTMKSDKEEMIWV